MQKRSIGHYKLGEGGKKLSAHDSEPRYHIQMTVKGLNEVGHSQEGHYTEIFEKWGSNRGFLSGGEASLVLTEGDLGSPTFCPQTLNRLTKHSLTRL